MYVHKHTHKIVNSIRINLVSIREIFGSHCGTCNEYCFPVCTALYKLANVSEEPTACLLRVLNLLPYPEGRT